MSFIEECGFVDKRREASVELYDLLEISSASKKRKELIRLMNRDPYFFDSYVVLSEELAASGEVKESIKVLNEGYRKADELLSFGGKGWPKVLAWGWHENRHIIRCLTNKAVLDWDLGDIDSALKILRYLLASNPSDNVGARFYILAIKEGMSLSQYEDEIERDGIVDDEFFEWFNRGIKKYSEEFSEWIKNSRDLM